MGDRGTRHLKKFDRELRDTLLINGYLKTNSQTDIPDELCDIFFRYLHVIPEWDKFNVFDVTIIDNDVFKKKPNNWFIDSHAYSAETVSKGQHKSWTLKLRDDASDRHYFYDTFFGIIESRFVTKQLEDSSHTEEYNGYALCSSDGNLYHGSEDHPVKNDYCKQLKPNDIIIVTLDLSESVSKGGKLAYEINNVDHGIAFDDIDVAKEYKLCVDCRGDNEYIVMLNV